MIYPRLRIARTLLTEDGALCISIDNHELANLEKVCNEVLGEQNFVCRFGWETKKAAQGMATANMIVDNQESIYVYAKNIDKFCFRGLDRDDGNGFSNPDNDPRGLWKRQYLQRLGQGLPIRTIVDPSNGNVFSFETPYAQEKLNRWIEENRIIFPTDTSKYPARKEFLCEYENLQQLVTALGLYPTKATTEKLYNMFAGTKIFTNPKPDTLIHFIIQQCTYNSDDINIVLDFFSGSATTAHAVMQLNAEDGGNRRFIMVQLPEPCAEKTEAYKAGYQNICEIGKERIRRAGEKIKQEIEAENAQLKMGEELKKVPDIGFKVFKLDSSNLKKWQPDYDDFNQSLLDSIDNYVEGRTELDVVYEIMLKMGLELTYPLETYTVKDKNIYVIAYGALMICLDHEITTGVAHEMIRLHEEYQPEIWQVVFKDNGFDSDSVKTNIKEMLKVAGLDEDAFTTI